MRRWRAFAVVGMMAVFGGISRAPLAVLLMVAQMTGNVSIAAPALVAVALSTFIARRFDDSIYRAQLHSRADSAASRMKPGLALLAALPVSSAAAPPSQQSMPSGRSADRLGCLPGQRTTLHVMLPMEPS